MKPFIAITIFLLCLTRWKSKIVLILSLLGLWFLMFNCGITFDSQNYIDEYDIISLTDTAKEPLYVFIVYFFHSMGLQYETYHAILSAIIIGIWGISTYKIARNYNLALGLFLLYPFALYVVQMRNCIAFAICMLAFIFLYNNIDETNKKSISRKQYNDIMFILLIVCATLIHSAYQLFLLFFLAEKLSLKKIIYTTTIIIALGSFFMNSSFLLNISGLFNVERRLEQALYFQSIDGQSDIGLRIIITFIMYLCCFWYLLYYNKYDGEDLTNKTIYNQNLLALKINILCMVIFPFVSLIREIFRIQEALMLFNYIVITNNLNNPCSKRERANQDYLILAALLFFIFVDAFLYILRFKDLRDYVLYPVFG